MRQQATFAKVRGKDKWVELQGPGARVDEHSQTFKDFRRNHNESADYEEVLVFEKVKKLRLSKPKAPVIQKGK